MSSEAGVPALPMWFGIMAMTWRSLTRLIRATRHDGAWLAHFPFVRACSGGSRRAKRNPPQPPRHPDRANRLSIQSGALAYWPRSYREYSYTAGTCTRLLIHTG